MPKYAVGYEDEMIGVYRGDTPEEAIKECKAEMAAYNIKPETPAKDRLKGMIANRI